MLKKPEGVDRETWLREREQTWRRRNWVLNGLILAAIAVVALRYFL